MKPVQFPVVDRRALLWALAPVLLAGCSMFGKAATTADEKTAAKPMPQLISQPGKKTVVVGIVDSAGARVALEREQQLLVRLPDIVAGGYEWSLVDFVPGVLDAQGPKFERALRSNSIAEFEGSSSWEFKPTGSGTVTLRFELRRPRNTAPAIQVAVYTVTVP